MGGICCVEDNSRENVIIDSELRTAKGISDKTKKLLLLGAGDSGKSTFFKQLQTLHGPGYDDNDRLAFKQHVFNQIIEQMQRIIARAKDWTENFPGDYDDCKLGPEALASASIVQAKRENEEIDQNFGRHIEILWKDPGIRATYERKSKFGIIESSAYFFDNIQRIVDLNYIPTQEDILLVRHRTTGVTDKIFVINNSRLRIFDVGGQRAERKKWIHCFDDVTAVLFVISLSGYDEALYEEESENVMHESLTLFGEICNNEWFTESAMIVFLNKSDIFAQKIQNTPLTVGFPDYKGPPSFESCIEYIKQQVTARNQSPTKKLFIHVTCATQKNNVLKLFDDVQKIIIHEGLSGSDLL